MTKHINSATANIDCQAMVEGFNILKGLPDTLQVQSRTKHLVQFFLGEGAQTQVHFSSVLTNLTSLIFTMINFQINASDDVICLSCLLHTFANPVD